MKTRLQKEEQVKDLTEKITRSKAIFFADYKGMTMQHLSTLRDQLSEQNAQFLVAKNTLLKIALKDSKKPALDDTLEGPTGTIFAYDDEITPIKALVKLIKDTGIGQVKAGILGDLILDATKVKQLASLPSKDELRAKTVGILVAPLQGIVGVLQGNLRNLVYALDQIKIQRGGEA